MNPLSMYSRPSAMFLAFGIAFFSVSCESPLSDMEITDPGVLQPHFAVERTLLEDGTVASAVTATILDKNLASVELKDGQVKVNGQQMSVTEILNISTYYIPGVTVDLNADYEFEVVLPNGESYGGTVTTQQKTFTSLTVPSTSNADSDLTISWEDVYVHDALIISLGFASPSGNVAGPTFELTPAQMQEGSFIIPKSNFATPEGITSVTITLTGAKYGTTDSDFRSGSATISRMRVQKTVPFN